MSTTEIEFEACFCVEVIVEKTFLITLYDEQFEKSASQAHNARVFEWIFLKVFLLKLNNSAINTFISSFIPLEKNSKSC